ncbi:MAG TPA: hypothetical protein VD927_16835, partial [Chryseosolibacter sp.]|nr:hypothetical protein [Chryseosolibacter sp.]
MLFIIVSVLIIGLILIVIEILFIPGTTLVGLLGLGFSIAGIILTYGHYGNEIGLYVLVGTSALKLALLIYSLRSGLWTKFSLKTAITSKVNEGLNDNVQVHEIGTT